MYLISIKQLTTHHIGPIDLSIKKSETVGISGSSGSGKTLLLRAIADLDPHNGELQLSGKDQLAFEPSVWRSRVAYLATESHWWGEIVGDHFNGDSEPWLELAGFSQEALQWSVERLSSGEKQRLAIVRQLIRQPILLLLDEPTSSLDSKSAARIEKMLLTYQQQMGAAIVWVSHHHDQLSRVSSRIFEMKSGKLQQWSTEELNNG
ncbi:MAG: ATP-binding cassette domain-containing protein [Thiotrichales bacterium]|jgi:ABC-type iron transport system FetAB ATPase subunit|nr:ATP-binding cassette domain-containing protein [Thiotrichales bacterium]MBT3612934.1 ATP-binding cassette domain-containing protein [Thiotrichales bacterium]MBT3752573.1 ATP-binding cassette domain-containing protein [Thiotrichales bacterium]MBT3837304.1 ATP-binding cassette domain-containing protein [Thiotrichales bacterium]MBT4261361.1 ATP-binding cassette domain-containing protein [Thiotrichales bacterium]